MRLPVSKFCWTPLSLKMAEEVAVALEVTRLRILEEPAKALRYGSTD